MKKVTKSEITNDSEGRYIGETVSVTYLLLGFIPVYHTVSSQAVRMS